MGAGADRRDDHAPGNARPHEARRARGEGLSERFQFSAGLGSGVLLSATRLPKVPVTDAPAQGELLRPGQPPAGCNWKLLRPGRAPRPEHRSRETNQPSFLLVPGTIYDNVDRWERLDVLDLRPGGWSGREARVPAGVDEAAGEPGRDAYVEQLVVNLFARRRARPKSSSTSWPSGRSRPRWPPPHSGGAANSAIAGWTRRWPGRGRRPPAEPVPKLPPRCPKAASRRELRTDNRPARSGPRTASTTTGSSPPSTPPGPTSPASEARGSTC